MYKTFQIGILLKIVKVESHIPGDDPSRSHVSDKFLYLSLLNIKYNIIQNRPRKKCSSVYCNHPDRRLIWPLLTGSSRWIRHTTKEICVRDKLWVAETGIIVLKNCNRVLHLTDDVSFLHFFMMICGDLNFKLSISFSVKGCFVRIRIPTHYSYIDSFDYQFFLRVLRSIRVGLFIFLFPFLYSLTVLYKLVS